ncbi:hypothetical protein SAMN05421833_10984 [Microbispora rosea]|uniref:DUF4328 domain-containing protein n=1 Tax=Microbispora rosea TaxID=58117 RepID=A0A1N7B0Z0_9ACTN|nr:hypothetical protein SAMN05421833_10984 [Microbispora rosea]
MRSTSSALSRAAAGVYAALAAQVVSVAALAVFEESRGRRLAAQIAAFGGDPASPAARTVSGAATAFAVLVLLMIGATVACAAAYLSWLRAVRPATPPVVLAAACLVPGVNLVVPPFLADLAWREGPAGRPRRSGPARGEPYDGRDRTRWLVVLSCWWVSWLAALGLVFAGPARDGLTGLGTPQAAAVAVAALLCASAVHEITARHTGTGGNRAARPAVRPQVRLGHGERPSGMPAAPAGGRAGAVPTDGGEEDHRPGGGPELPELACQSRRWGADGWPRNRPSRTAGGAPLSE